MSQRYVSQMSDLYGRKGCSLTHSNKCIINTKILRRMENGLCVLSFFFPSPSFHSNFTSHTQLQKDVHPRVRRCAAEWRSVFAGEGSVVTAFVLSYDVEHRPHGSMLRKGERKATACHPLTDCTFGPAKVAGENMHSPWYTDGKMMFITAPD